MVQSFAFLSMRIGVFDSGVGGMTVVKALRKECPTADIIYFGDTARVPYGTKSKNTIIRYTGQVLSFLLDSKVDIIVAACNTASALGIGHYRKKISIPMVDVIQPACEKIASRISKGPVLVLATKATISSKIYSKTLSKLIPESKVIEKSCPLFVPLVEEGLTKGPLAKIAVAQYLRGVPKPEAVLLGCTHYPLLREMISKFWKGRVDILDSADETARRTRVLMSISNQTALNQKGSDKSDSRIKVRKGSLKCYVSDDPEAFQQQAFALTKLRPQSVHHCDIETYPVLDRWTLSSR